MSVWKPRLFSKERNTKNLHWLKRKQTDHASNFKRKANNQAKDRTTPLELSKNHRQNTQNED